MLHSVSCHAESKTASKTVGGKPAVTPSAALADAAAAASATAVAAAAAAAVAAVAAAAVARQRRQLTE